MRRNNRYRFTPAVSGALGVLAGTIVLAAQLTGSGPREIVGQQEATLAPEVQRAFSQAGEGERVPVVLELAPAAVPRPFAPERRLRAVEQASNLAGTYGRATERLRLAMPADVALDMLSADLLWVGGALVMDIDRRQMEALRLDPRVRRIHYDGLVRVDLQARPGSLTRGHPPLLAPRTRPSLALQDPAGGLPWGLIAIGAPQVWAQGATGQGAVVAIIDSGVDLDHPLLKRNWRGLNVPAQRAWFDPWGLSESPVDDNNTGGVGHGTIVATAAVGSLAPGDTLIEFSGTRRAVQDELEVVTGAAPGAEWAAVNAFEEFGGFSYTRLSVLLQALQWVLDPDGDPTAPSDVADVVNNSWGFVSDGCSGLFDRAIDALELAGIPVVFASGNRSTGSDTVASPASRADLLLNAFAVGAAEQRDGEVVVAENSLGGPTPCAADAVKPEVVAPGSVPVVRREGESTALVTGRSGAFTSWAAPHASGAIAVLRGLNPSAMGTELKDALFATAVDLPPGGLDNRSGAGLIDLQAAAGRVGGLGGVRLAVAGFELDSASRALTVDLRVTGDEPFPGGSAELRQPAAGTIASVPAPWIAPRSRAGLRFELGGGDVDWDERLMLRLESAGAVLDFRLRRQPSVTAVQLNDAGFSFSLDANGRLGQVAGPPGFEFLGADWLAGGGLLFGRGEQVSDGVYVDVLSRPALKSNPVGSDTDWSGQVRSEAGGQASLELHDRLALLPQGVELEEAARLVATSDSAGFVILRVKATFAAQGEAPLLGLFLDWDLGLRDTVSWDDGLSASVMTAGAASGPWMALATTPRPPATHAAVPLGLTATGFYSLGSGVLAGSFFDDEQKARLMRLGGEAASGSGVDDWAQLVTAGPLQPGETATFLIAAGATREAMSAALDSARSLAASTAPGGSTSGAVTGLELLPPYPNPFDPTAGGTIKLPFLVARGSGEVTASLDIYTISGRRLLTLSRQIGPGSPLEPFEWDGREADGDPVATGVYGYLLKVGPARKFGKFIVLK